jgi:hypothetical protein
VEGVHDLIDAALDEVDRVGNPLRDQIVRLWGRFEDGLCLGADGLG